MGKNKNVIQNRYEGPWIFFIVIPLGIALILMLTEIGMNLYNQNTLNKFTKVLLTEIMENSDFFDTQEEYEEFINKYLEEKKVNNTTTSIMLEDDNTILITYKTYESLLGSFTKNKNKTVTSRYQASLNEYKEVVIKKYVENEDDFVLGS